MEQYLNDTLGPITKSPKTLKNRVSFLMSIAKQVPNAHDMSFLNKQSIVMKRVNDSDVQSTRLTRLMHVIVACDAAAPLIHDRVRAFYGRQVDKVKPKAQAKQDNNLMTDEHKEKYITLNSLDLLLGQAYIDLFNEYKLKRKVLTKEDIERLRGMGSRKNLFTFAKGLQECVLMAAYVWQPAIRNNYGDLHITKRKTRLSTEKNYLYIGKDGKYTLIMNAYKNAHSMGKQELEITKEFGSILTIWLSLLRELIGSDPEYPLLYSINAKGDVSHIEATSTVQRQIPRVAERIFGKPLTINDFRHIREIAIQSSQEYRFMTIAERTELHRQLLHGHDVALRYNLLRRDE